MENDVDNGQFSDSSLGGHIAGRIATQDGVAFQLAVEAIGNRIEEVPAGITGMLGRISLEKFDDIEIRWDDGAVIVSVKDKLITRSDIKKEIAKFRDLEQHEDLGDNVSFRIECTAVDGPGRKLSEAIDRLRSVSRIGVPSEWSKAAKDFEREYDIDVSSAVRVVVSVRDLRPGSRSAHALFSAAVRGAFPVANFSDDALVGLFEEYVDGKISRARRNRETLLLSELEHSILYPLLPPEMVTDTTSFIRTKYGYVRDPKMSESMHEDGVAVTSAVRNVVKRWSRHTRKSIWNTWTYGPIRCPFCNGPMHRSIWRDKAFTCARCRFQPYMTLFYACDCGDPVCVLRQPTLDGYTAFSELLDRIREESIECDKCHAKIKEEKLHVRIFAAGVPWPVEQFKESDLIRIREEVGWSGARYKIRGETPFTLMHNDRWDEISSDWKF